MPDETRDSGASGPGIRGGLLVPLGLLGLWCVSGVIAAVRFLPNWAAETVKSGARSGLDHPAYVLPTFALLVFSLYCLVRFLQKKREVRVLMMVLCALVLVLTAALYVFPPHDLRGGPAVLAAGTLVYFAVSKRVRNTFIR